MTLTELIHEQMLEYGSKLKEVEKEIIRKYKSGEDYSEDVVNATGLKMMIKEAVRLMMEKR